MGRILSSKVMGSTLQGQLSQLVQDTAQMLFSCGIESDDNGEAEVGEFAYYFPKLNLSASLYDKSNLRAHSEVGGALSTAMDKMSLQPPSPPQRMGLCLLHLSLSTRVTLL